MNVKFGVGDRLVSLLILSAIVYKYLAFHAFLAFFVALISTWIFFLYDEKQYWHTIGIPGPNVNIFFGAMIDLFFRKKSYKVDQEMLAKYGNSYGSFNYGRREFCTKDPELLRRIFIKDFPMFQNRMFGMPNPKRGSRHLFPNTLVVIRNADWKRVRNRVTPAFTTGKLKKLIPTLCGSTDRLCHVIEHDFIAAKKEIPLKDLFSRLVLEIIGHAGFSLKFNTFEERNNEFVKNTEAISAMKWFRQRLAFMVFCPLLAHCYEQLTGWDPVYISSVQFFENFMDELYKQRKADPEANEKYLDIFQFLLNAVEEEEEGDTVNGHGTVQTMETVKNDKALSRVELFAQALVLFIAGYDSTASNLAFAAYMLAMNREIQNKLRDEIHSVLENEETITYEHMNRMPYLQAIMQETAHVPSITEGVRTIGHQAEIGHQFEFYREVSRECSQNCVINGIPFCKGDVVTMPIYMIQHDEKNFPNPEKFQPERFMPENKASRDPLTFLTFGLGPRICLGQRFAEFQMHVAMAQIIRRFRLIPGPNTPKLPLQLLSTEFLSPATPLVVLAEKI